jgi:putative nucleotidyltransferase with HDIG domain
MAHEIAVPTYIVLVYSKIVASGYEAYLVGGAVRDVLMGKTPNDWDIATSATPEQIQEVFGEDSFYDNTFGTVGVVVREKERAGDRAQRAGVDSGQLTVEQDKSLKIKEEDTNEIVHVTTYRSEGEYTDFRRPDSVEWGKTIRDDLQRRDFTINAIALKIVGETKDQREKTKDELIVLGVSDFVIVDPYGGLVDLHHKLIRAVGDPNARFDEDALRMLRAVRFHSQLDFEIALETVEAIHQKAKNISHISGERIRDELWKILKSDRAYEGIKMLDQVELLQYILPEVVAGRGLDQRGHHVYDVFDHSLQALHHCPSKDPIVRFAALLHDIGKSVTHEVREGINTFYNHDIVGAKLVNQISYRLHLSKKDRQKLHTLVRFHMFNVDTILTDAAIRRFIAKVGVENISDMMDLRIGDRLGSGTKEAEGWRLKEFKSRIEQLLMPTFTVKDLVIDGNDVMRILNIKPGRKIGETLSQLFEEVLDDPERNTREYLEKRVVEINQ